MNHLNPAALIIIAFISLMAMTACGKRAILHQYQPVDSEGWANTDTLRFHIPHIHFSDDTEDKQPFSFSLGVRTMDHIPYRDLWLVMESRTETETHRDTVYILLASDRPRWQTQGNILHEIEQEVTTQTLHEGQQLDILVYHVMSRQNLPGITEVGLKIN